MSEKGHAKNLENIRIARDFATSWGVKYAPFNVLIQLTNLNAVIDAAEPSLDAVIDAKTPYRNAVAAAQDAFDPLNELMTRVINALKASGVPDSVVEDAKTYTRKIKGQRAKPKPTDDPNTPDFDESAAAHSASQMSRTNRIENLDSLISLLQSQTLYKPNEAGIKVNDLIALSDDLKAKFQAVQASFITLSNERAARDVIFYADETGIVAIGNLFKRYAESFGRSSSEWAQVKDLEFTVIKRK